MPSGTCAVSRCDSTLNKGIGTSSATIRRFSSSIRRNFLIYPHAKAASKDKYALSHRDVGFLVSLTGELASSNHSNVGSRLASKLSTYRRLRVAHLLIHQRGKPTLLGQISFQDYARYP